MDGCARNRPRRRPRALYSRPVNAWPDLREGAVHVWRADLDAAARDDTLAVLPYRERRRALCIVDTRRRERWARSRRLLRLVLGEYLAVEPHALELVRGANGKLALAAPAPLLFNIAHSGAVGLYAISCGGEIGVDVEVPRARALREIELAARAFGDAQARRLGMIAPEERAREFRRLWVRHEAALKCAGEGIFAAAPVARARTRAREPWLRDLDLGEGVLAAVALEREPSELACFELGDRREAHLSRGRELSRSASLRPLAC